jgi:hypothetical protein
MDEHDRNFLKMLAIVVPAAVVATIAIYAIVWFFVTHGGTP